MIFCINFKKYDEFFANYKNNEFSLEFFFSNIEHAFLLIQTQNIEQTNKQNRSETELFES